MLRADAGEDRSLVICHGEVFAQRDVLTNKSAITTILTGNGDVRNVIELLDSLDTNKNVWVDAFRNIDRCEAFRLSDATSEDGKKRWARTEHNNLKGVISYFKNKLCKVSRTSHNSDMRDLKSCYFAAFPEAVRPSNMMLAEHNDGEVDGKADCAYPSGSETEGPIAAALQNDVDQVVAAPDAAHGGSQVVAAPDAAHDGTLGLDSQVVASPDAAHEELYVHSSDDDMKQHDEFAIPAYVLQSVDEAARIGHLLLLLLLLLLRLLFLLLPLLLLLLLLLLDSKDVF